MAGYTPDGQNIQVPLLSDPSQQAVPSSSHTFPASFQADQQRVYRGAESPAMGPSPTLGSQGFTALPQNFPNTPGPLQQLIPPPGQEADSFASLSPTIRRCNCKKSKCLKLYCECFASKVFCNGCNCQQCLNTSAEAELVAQTQQLIESRNPEAFKSKIVTNNAKVLEQGIDARHKKGCHCKRSFCLKKYCECFQAGVQCSQACKCVKCRNHEGAGPSDPTDAVAATTSTPATQHSTKSQQMTGDSPLVFSKEQPAPSHTPVSLDMGVVSLPAEYHLAVQELRGTTLAAAPPLVTGPSVSASPVFPTLSSAPRPLKSETAQVQSTEVTSTKTTGKTSTEPLQLASTPAKAVNTPLKALSAREAFIPPASFPVSPSSQLKHGDAGTLTWTPRFSMGSSEESALQEGLQSRGRLEAHQARRLSSSCVLSPQGIKHRPSAPQLPSPPLVPAPEAVAKSPALMSHPLSQTPPSAASSALTPSPSAPTAQPSATPQGSVPGPPSPAAGLLDGPAPPSFSATPAATPSGSAPASSTFKLQSASAAAFGQHSGALPAPAALPAASPSGSLPHRTPASAPPPGVRAAPVLASPPARPFLPSSTPTKPARALQSPMQIEIPPYQPAAPAPGTAAAAPGTATAPLPEGSLPLISPVYPPEAVPAAPGGDPSFQGEQPPSFLGGQLPSFQGGQLPSFQGGRPPVMDEVPTPRFGPVSAALAKTPGHEAPQHSAPSAAQPLSEKATPAANSQSETRAAAEHTAHGAQITVERLRPGLADATSASQAASAASEGLQERASTAGTPRGLPELDTRAPVTSFTFPSASVAATAPVPPPPPSTSGPPAAGDSCNAEGVPYIRRCHCKKSKCLKLYCECFASREFCTNCSCVQCLNTVEHVELVQRARQSIQLRDPTAFAPKVQGDAGHRHKKGCHCKRSFCLKKYCECYQAGVLCSEACKCESCKNCDLGMGEDGAAPRPFDQDHQRVEPGSSEVPAATLPAETLQMRSAPLDVATVAKAAAAHADDLVPAAGLLRGRSPGTSPVRQTPCKNPGAWAARMASPPNTISKRRQAQWGGEPCSLCKLYRRMGCGTEAAAVWCLRKGMRSAAQRRRRSGMLSPQPATPLRGGRAQSRSPVQRRQQSTPVRGTSEHIVGTPVTPRAGLKMLAELSSELGGALCTPMSKKEIQHTCVSASKYRGVVYHRTKSKWIARFYHSGGECTHLGSHDDEEAAKNAYDSFRAQLHLQSTPLPLTSAGGATPLPLTSAANPSELVGCRAKCWREQVKGWRSATISAYDPIQGSYVLRFDNGKEQSGVVLPSPDVRVSKPAGTPLAALTPHAERAADVAVARLAAELVAVANRLPMSAVTDMRCEAWTGFRNSLAGSTTARHVASQLLWVHSQVVVLSTSWAPEEEARWLAACRSFLAPAGRPHASSLSRRDVNNTPVQKWGGVGSRSKRRNGIPSRPPQERAPELMRRLSGGSGKAGFRQKPLARLSSLLTTFSECIDWELVDRLWETEETEGLAQAKLIAAEHSRHRAPAPTPPVEADPFSPPPQQKKGRAGEAKRRLEESAAADDRSPGAPAAKMRRSLAEGRSAPKPSSSISPKPDPSDAGDDLLGSTSPAGILQRRVGPKGKGLAKSGKSSKFRGVSWHRERGQWLARLYLKAGRHVHLGYHDTEEAAAKAILVASRKRRAREAMAAAEGIVPQDQTPPSADVPSLRGATQAVEAVDVGEGVESSTLGPAMPAAGGGAVTPVSKPAALSEQSNPRGGTPVQVEVLTGMHPTSIPCLAGFSTPVRAAVAQAAAAAVHAVVADENQNMTVSFAAAVKADKDLQRPHDRERVPLARVDNVQPHQASN
ncbi:hypothetical protein CYMTET_47595 [Cymbomonas tetramitiformis]|uniref:CRC domain-containing protein n=1 Tax=Cymbomonas tetramitiformis TaxID=36881 RepID=A0AAE0BTX5_9CHLO|nr:hypothetical protein CYMTET_47595 [Cymbomonas tetramitiformis]